MGIKIIGCGGCGITALNNFSKKGFFSKDISMLGLDTSDANIIKGVDFKVELVPGTSGSGSDQSLNVELYIPFLKRVLAKEDKEDVYVILYSGGGGTGSSMGPTLHQLLTEEGIPTLSVIVGDKTSLSEATNTVRALINLTNYASAGYPIIYSYFDNGTGKTQGEVNDDVSSFLDMIKLMFDHENHFIDKADINHFFFYNKVVKATPVLSCLEFISESAAESYDRNVVAAISLFQNQDGITQTFQQLLYRKAGVIADKYKGVFEHLLPIHAVLDHGDSVKEVNEMVERQRKRNVEINAMYTTQSSINEVKTEPARKGFVKYDI